MAYLGVMSGPGASVRPERSRLRWALAAGLVIGAGLLWRPLVRPLWPVAAKYGGDALWALMVYCGFGLLLRRASVGMLALAALGFSFAVEFSQLWHVPWLDALRATLPGRLVLGSTFNAPDLGAYAAGILAGASAETLLLRRQRAIARR